MTELFINNTSVNLSNELQHSLNYAIADIREPDKRDTSFSKTITLVGSKETNILFGHLFEVNVTVNSSGTTNFQPSFNPNLKASAIMYADNIMVFSGYVQLKNIIVQDKYEVEYEVVMYGKLGDIFFNLGEKELTELDLSEFNHVFSKTNIVNSWSVANVGTGYHYTMIDRGLNDTITWKVRDWAPSVYLRTYIDKIFGYAGYTYDCDFFNTNFFKRLHMPYVGEGLRLSEDEINLRRFKARQTSAVTNNAFSGLGTWTTWQFNSETFDDGNDYNTSTYQWTCPANGRYIFNADIIASLRFVPASPAYYRSVGGSLNQVLGWCEIVRQTGSSTPVTIASINFFGSLPTIELPGSSLITGDTTYASATKNINTGAVSISAGEKIYVRFNLLSWNPNVASYNIFTDASNLPVTGNIYLVTNVGSLFENSIVNDGFAEGETMLLNAAIPTKIKMRDLLSSTLKKFNLYVEDDKREQNKVIITPRNDFYNNETEDWSSRLDLNSPFNIEPMGGLNAKRYELTWDYDEDLYNKYYKDKYNKTYGNRTIDVANDFVSNTVTTKTIWAATVPANNDVSDRIVPTILAADGSSKQISAKPRLLYYGGTRFCDPWYFLGDAGSTTYYQYPYSGHLDDPLNSTVDLNFGVVSELMYTAQTIIYTNNNVYNKYHKQFIDEITDKDSKIVTAFFRLTPSDILRLDFRKNYFFDNNYYRLNRIFDYNPDGDGLTKCEFIKILSATTFVSSGIVFNGGAAELGTLTQNDETYPTFKTAPQSTTRLDGGVYGNYVRGIDNLVSPSARNIQVVGDYNVIGGGVDGAIVINSSGNVIAGGLQNVTLINSTGQNVTDSNIAFINNNLITNPLYDYYFNSGATGTGADTNLTTLYTYNIPPNTLRNNGDTIVIEVSFATNANGNTKTGRIVFDSDEIANHVTSTSAEIITFVARVTRVDSGTFSYVTKTVTSTNDTNVSQNAFFTDFGDVIPVTFTGQNGTASANDIRVYDVVIYVLRKK